jgi:5-methylcytosine-specific restriction endonuclease McrA
MKNWKLRYKNYINSPKWRKKRLKILNERGWNCEDCGSRENLEVHHLHYRSLKHEKSKDLKVLCRFCHSLVDEHHMKASGYAFLEE